MHEYYYRLTLEGKNRPNRIVLFRVFAYNEKESLEDSKCEKDDFCEEYNILYDYIVKSFDLVNIKYSKSGRYE